MCSVYTMEYYTSMKNKITNSCKNMVESHKYYGKLKKLGTKGHRLSDLYVQE